MEPEMLNPDFGSWAKALIKTAGLRGSRSQGFKWIIALPVHRGMVESELATQGCKKAIGKQILELANFEVYSRNAKRGSCR